MTKSERCAIHKVSEQILLLTNLENYSFDDSNGKDTEIKNAIRPYMINFDKFSNLLDNLCLEDERGDSNTKKKAIHEIFRNFRYLKWGSLT